MSNPTDTTGCPRCGGKGSTAAFVDTETRGYFDPSLRCSLCLGDGRISATTADWLARGEAHYKARVARGESVRECARRLGIGAAELSGMEHGRADPSKLEASIQQSEAVSSGNDYASVTEEEWAAYEKANREPWPAPTGNYCATCRWWNLNAEQRTDSAMAECLRLPGTWEMEERLTPRIAASVGAAVTLRLARANKGDDGMRTETQWLELTRIATRGLSEAQAREVARRCYDAEASGNPSSVWHEAAAVCGTPCHCRRCDPS